MPTEKRRLYITPTDEMWEVLDRFHAVTGTSRARLMVEFMDPVLGQMDDVVNLLEEMADRRDVALRETKAVVQHAIGRLTGAAREAISVHEDASARTGSEPPSSNTGATDPQRIEIIRPAKTA